MTPTAEPSAITGISGPSTAPNASVPTAASTTPGTKDGGVGSRAQPLERRVAAITGQEGAREDDEQRPQNGQPEHEEPWRRRIPERGRELMPQPVLEPVDQAKEKGRGQRRRDPDEGRDADEAQVFRGRRRCLGRAIHRQPG